MVDPADITALQLALEQNNVSSALCDTSFYVLISTQYLVDIPHQVSYTTKVFLQLVIFAEVKLSQVCFSLQNIGS